MSPSGAAQPSLPWGSSQLLRLVKHLVHALPASWKMFLSNSSLALLSLDEFAISSSCGLDAGDFHPATGSPKTLSVCLVWRKED